MFRYKCFWYEIKLVSLKSIVAYHTICIWTHWNVYCDQIITFSFSVCMLDLSFSQSLKRANLREMENNFCGVNWLIFVCENHAFRQINENEINLLWKSCGFDAKLFVLPNKMWYITFDAARVNDVILSARLHFHIFVVRLLLSSLLLIFGFVVVYMPVLN